MENTSYYLPQIQMFSLYCRTDSWRQTSKVLFLPFAVWPNVMPNREVKHDVYSKRQTAKMKRSLFSCVSSRVKLFVFAMNSRKRYSIFVCFIYGLEENNSKSEVIFAICRQR